MTKKKRRPLDASTLEARDAQRGLGAEVLIAFAPHDQECFANALLSPPKPAPALERALARRSKLLRTE